MRRLCEERRREVGGEDKRREVANNREQWREITTLSVQPSDE